MAQTDHPDRRHLLDATLAESQALDRTLITLAAGSVVLSVTLVTGLSCRHVSKPMLIGAGWILMGFALLAVLLSQRASIREHSHKVANWDSFDNEAEDESKRLSKRTAAWNSCALTAFAAGLVALAAFAYINVL